MPGRSRERRRPIGSSAAEARIRRGFTGLLERVSPGPYREPGAIWVHSASVGEARASAVLIRALRGAGRPVIASSFTATGRDTLARELPDVPLRLAPLDGFGCCGRALARVRPAALVLVETELWPALLRAARRQGVPVVVVSGRLSERSLGRYRRLGPLFRSATQAIGGVAARTLRDAERFAALGIPAARIAVTGDLKLEVADPEGRLDPALDRALGESPLFVAASTHAGEESVVFDAVAALAADGHDVVSVVAPRHPRRADGAIARARERGLTARLRSGLELEKSPTLSPGEVLILDSVGELPSLFHRARAAFVGGSLVPRGGHNLVESARAGCPVVYGPHVENVVETAELLEACGAAQRVDGARGLADALRSHWRHPGSARAAGEAGRLAVLARAGCAARTVEHLERSLALPPAGASPFEVG